MARQRALSYKERVASTAVEFAIVLPVLFTLIFGAAEQGLLWWTKNSLQLTAALTARCLALGSCTDPSSFAVSSASTWTLPNSITASDVSYATDTSCYSGTNLYAKVTINCPFWGENILPPPFSNFIFSVSACYPMA